MEVNIGDGTLVRVAYDGTLQDRMASVARVAPGAWIVRYSPGTEQLAHPLSFSTPIRTAISRTAQNRPECHQIFQLQQHRQHGFEYQLRSRWLNQISRIAVANLGRCNCTRHEVRCASAQVQRSLTQGSVALDRQPIPIPEETVGILGKQYSHHRR
ncbi:MAG: hypothetical protein IPJ67_00005 [Candidatus Moraniibacteriota bacterium]|nr:MAG: hypothetical protein IPJ67_00005 [Candidatus Moranbacteria bacterium]